MYIPNKERAALLAASQASEAASELLRYHMEGPAGSTAFGDVDVVGILAQALSHACRIELADCKVTGPVYAAFSTAIEQFGAACDAFAEQWAECGVTA